MTLPLGTDKIASNNFLGVGTPVIVNYPDPNIAYTLATGSGAGLYSNNLDIFGRVINCLWQQTVGDVTTALASLGYGYDYASNRQWRQDNVAESLSKYFDEFYGLDGVYRVTGLARGQLTGTPPIGVTGQTFGEDWTLDPTGNWDEYKQLSDASTVTLDQTRTASAVNEITAIDVTTPSDAPWAQPGYDAAGNPGAPGPQPNSPGNPYASTFDAWQRMRFLYDMTVPTAPVQVQENQYDGRNFRVVRIIPTESGTETRDFYHNDSWQVLQEYVSGYVDRQYVWGLRYIDDLVLRDRSVSSPGALNERFYALQDDNWNVVAIYNATTDAIDQRFAYSAYGILLPLNPDFTAYTGSGYDWTVLYTGRELDIATGLMYYRMRYYIPLLGVFLGNDPVGLVGGVNLYAYCSDDPVRLTDPSGMQFGEDFSDACQQEMRRQSHRKQCSYTGDAELKSEPIAAGSNVAGLKYSCVCKIHCMQWQQDPSGWHPTDPPGEEWDEFAAADGSGTVDTFASYKDYIDNEVKARANAMNLGTTRSPGDPNATEGPTMSDVNNLTAATTVEADIASGAIPKEDAWLKDRQKNLDKLLKDCAPICAKLKGKLTVNEIGTIGTEDESGR